jgi:hypothetical protein
MSRWYLTHVAVPPKGDCPEEHKEATARLEQLLAVGWEPLTVTVEDWTTWGPVGHPDDGERGGMALGYCYHLRRHGRTP